MDSSYKKPSARSAALALALALLAIPAAAHATSLSWSSIDYASNPLAEDVLGDGLMQVTQPTNVKVIVAYAVSCPSAAQCTVFGNAGTGTNQNGAVATFDPSPLTAGPRAVVDTTNGAGFTGTCLSTSLCVAVDEERNAVAFDPTTPGTPSLVAIDPDSIGGLVGVSCPAVNECVALDSSGAALVFNPGSLSSAATTRLPLDSSGSWGFTAIACASPTQCSAVGDQGQAAAWDAVTFNPQASGTVPQPAVIGPATNNTLSGLACPSVDQCTAVGNGNDEITFDPSSPGTPTVIPFHAPIEVDGIQGTAQITCVSTAECLATLPGADAVDVGDPAATNPGWTSEAVPVGVGETFGSVGAAIPLGCAGTSLCVAASNAVSVGTVGSSPPPGPTHTKEPHVTRPKATGFAVADAFLKGLGQDRAELNFIVRASAVKAPLAGVTITLPSGLKFASSNSTLMRATSVSNGSGGPVRFKLSRGNGAVTIDLQPAQGKGTETDFAFTSKAFKVSSSLASSVASKKVTLVTVTVDAVETNRAVAHLSLTLKV